MSMPIEFLSIGHLNQPESCSNYNIFLFPAHVNQSILITWVLTKTSMIMHFYLNYCSISPKAVFKLTTTTCTRKWIDDNCFAFLQHSNFFITHHKGAKSPTTLNKMHFELHLWDNSSKISWMKILVLKCWSNFFDKNLNTSTSFLLQI